MLVWLLAIFSLLLFWQFLGYPMSMWLVGSRQKPGISAVDCSFLPFVSIIVPAYNEENVIGRRIEDLLSLDYPGDRFEVIVVVSGSTDGTAEAAGKFGAEYANVRVIEEDVRRGKAAAINLGRKYAGGEIVMVTDANTLFSKNVLKEIVPHFRDSGTGAVGGRFVISNPENGLLRASSFYWRLESLIRRGESAMDSACLFHGEINAWRKDIVEADTGSLAEDLDMAIRIRRRGFKIVYEPGAIAYEAGPVTGKEQVIQKKRAAVGTIQALFRHKKYLWLPRDIYAGIIFPSHKTLQALSPFLLLGLLAVLVMLTVSGEWITLTAWVPSAAVLFAVLFGLLNRGISSVRDDGDSSAGAVSPAGLPGILYYVLLHEYIVLLAWKDYITGNYSVTWRKAESTR